MTKLRGLVYCCSNFFKVFDNLLPSFVVPQGGRRVEAQRVLPRGQRRGVHAAPHAPGGREQAQAHLHPEVFRVRRRDSSDGGVRVCVATCLFRRGFEGTRR